MKFRGSKKLQIATASTPKLKSSYCIAKQKNNNNKIKNQLLLKRVAIDTHTTKR